MISPLLARRDAAQAALDAFLGQPFAWGQADCVRLMQALCAETGDTEILRFAEMHRDIIDRFGRFPHRNAALGRESTPAELAYLSDGGFAG